MNVVSVNTLGDNPWNVLVSWDKSISQKGRLVVKINTFLRVPTGVYACSLLSREVSIYSANVNNFLVGSSPSRVVVLNAVYEVKRSVGVSDVVV